MTLNTLHVGSMINLFLMMVSLGFMWYSFFYFPLTYTFADEQNYFDELLRPHDTCYLYLVGFSTMLLFVSLFGYMSLKENEDLMIITEMLFLLAMTALEVYSICYLYAEEEKLNLKVANYMYKGVVLPHKLHKNSNDMTLELTYQEINGFKWRCCGIYSWKDAESYRPKDCCRTGYKGDSGKGTCNELYGPYVRNCVDARSTVALLRINKYALIVAAMILVQFFGLMLCNMVLFIQSQHKRPFAIAVRDLFVRTRQNMNRRSIPLQIELQSNLQK